ncbi:hypothetical protein PENSUB_4429 [Penicillium subrubescens]|uniref:Uncharacterized protein n=1 Tax=Penicillium subrubescens TaxID=1316194 RepID=A0A1Q5UCH7_9EURO|nr:hypothetical protein PENSUB_4429 [Penicillium subrubescens]
MQGRRSDFSRESGTTQDASLASWQNDHPLLREDCPRIDAINISQRQLDYFADTIPADLAACVHLYLCNG